MPQIEGLNRKTSPYLTRLGEVRECQNIDFSTIGRAKKTGDYTITAAQITASQDILGMGMFKRGAGTYEHYVVCDGASNSEIYKNVPGWTTQSQSLTAAKRGYFISMPELDFLFFCNLSDDTRGYNGAAWSTATNLDTAPKAQYLNAHETRLFLGNVDVSGTVYPCRYYFSSSGTGGSFDTWDTTNDYYVLPEPITGFAENNEDQLVFTKHFVFRGDADEKKMIGTVGAENQDVIYTFGNWTLFANSTGVYATDQSSFQKISQAVQEYIDGISTVSDMRGTGTGEFYYLYLGTTTVDGKSLSNVVLIYDISQNKWSRLSLGESVKVMGTFISSGVESVYFGNDDGEIFQLFTGDSQNGSDYTAFMEFPPISIGRAINTYQQLKVYGDTLNGLVVQVKAKKNDRWRSTGELRGEVDTVTFSPSLTSEFLYTRLVETGQGGDFAVDKIVVGYNQYSKD